MSYKSKFQNNFYSTVRQFLNLETQKDNKYHYKNDIKYCHIIFDLSLSCVSDLFKINAYHVSENYIAFTDCHK
jgi:hypothetical protein